MGGGGGSAMGGGGGAAMGGGGGAATGGGGGTATGGGGGTATGGGGGAATDGGTTGCGSVTAYGRCVDASTVEFCSTPTGDAVPTLVTYSCRSDEACQVTSGTAGCVLTTQCRTGSARCTGTASIENCVSGAWVAASCPQRCVANSLGDFCAPSSASTAFSATISYEYRTPNLGFTDWSATVSTAPARGLLVLSLQGSTPFDATVTDDSGNFTVKVPSPPTTGDRIVLATAEGNRSGGFRYVVANPDLPAGVQPAGSAGSAANIWTWNIPATSSSGQSITISEAQNSAAIHVFSYLRPVYAGTSAIYGRDGKPVVFWIGPEVSWNCGACAAPWPTNLGSSSFAAQIWLGADSINQQQYSDPVTAHELGHWVMLSYGTIPNEGGTHYIGNPTFPGQAWAEGFATWFSSAARGNGRYYDKQRGGFLWFDVASRNYNNKTWFRPMAAGGLLQKHDENDVSAILLQISTARTDGFLHVLRALESPQMNTAPWGRGYTRHTWQLNGTTFTNVVDTGESKPMFADMLDALVCTGMPTSVVDAATVPNTYYPYPSAAPICPGGACSGCRDTAGSCQAGNTATHCGSYGGACRACVAGQTCQNGGCVDACSATCSGCCSNNTCNAGNIAQACGSGGETCVACAPSEVCSAGTCRRAAGATCTQNTQCVSDLCVLDYGSQTQGHCRSLCSPGASTCSSGHACMPLAQDGACIPVPQSSSQWRVTLAQASVKSVDGSGAAWDGFGGLPDPRACLTTAATGTTCTSEASDTLLAQWSTPLSAAYSYSDLGNVSIRVDDIDLTSNDLIDTFSGVSFQCPWSAYPCSGTFDRSTSPGSGLNYLYVVVEPN